MLDIKTYLESGIIENYCLGLTSETEARQLEAYVMQYPEVKRELEAAQDTLLNSLEAYRKEAPEGTEQNILNAVSDLQLQSLELSPESGELPEFVPISSHSDLNRWKTLVQDINPPEDFDLHVHTLFEEPDRKLYIAWFNGEVPDEVHDDLLESIFILEGTCIGILEDKRMELGPGDYVKVPLHAHHSLVVTSDHPVKLILSRVAVA